MLTINLAYSHHWQHYNDYRGDRNYYLHVPLKLTGSHIPGLNWGEALQIQQTFSLLYQLLVIQGNHPSDKVTLKHI